MCEAQVTHLYYWYQLFLVWIPLLSNSCANFLTPEGIVLTAVYICQLALVRSPSLPW